MLVRAQPLALFFLMEGSSMVMEWAGSHLAPVDWDDDYDDDFDDLDWEEEEGYWDEEEEEWD